MIDHIGIAGITCVAVIVVQIGTATLLGDSQGDASKKAKEPAFSLADVKYFHRYSKDDQHEYTPAGQEDLNRWTDMITTHKYPQAKDGGGLASVANAVLENYKAHKAMVLKTSSVPRTPEKPAEHLIAVLFPRPEFIEAVFSRFKMHESAGVAIIYSHRVYGKKAGNEMSAWLQKNGAAIDKRMMEWTVMPKPPTTK